MCRYAFHKYKPHYVCFDCRKTFKQPLVEDMIIQNGEWDLYKRLFLEYPYPNIQEFRAKNQDKIAYFQERYLQKSYRCPDCRQEMYNMGRDFKAPKREKVKEWKIVRSMYKVGHSFQTCGCNGPGYIPHKASEYLEYLSEKEQLYQEKLANREEKCSGEELADYLNYWNAKLEIVKKVIQENKTNSL